MSKSRERLLALEKEGKFVFHGSSKVIDALEPQQAYNYNQATGEQEPDGAPAVFATPFANVAIFRALINTDDVIGDSTSNFDIDDAGLHFSATQNLLDQAKLTTGRVYVLDKKQFSECVGMQCRSNARAVPIETIQVTFADLPENIKIISE